MLYIIISKTPIISSNFASLFGCKLLRGTKAMIKIWKENI